MREGAFNEHHSRLNTTLTSVRYEMAKPYLDKAQGQEWVVWWTFDLGESGSCVPGVN